MKVLILSCNTGQGHNAAGLAMEEIIKSHGQEAIFLDMMTLSGRKTSKIVEGAYVNLVKYCPHGFGFIYQIGMAISSANRKSPVYYANGFLSKALQAYLKEHPVDIIVTPHVFGAEVLTYMKQKLGIAIPKCVGIATDYTCIPFWEETDCDYYIIPHKDFKKEYKERGIPTKKLLAYGIPIREKFKIKENKELLRRKLGIPLQKKVHLIMGGSMGFGKIRRFAYELQKSATHGEYIIIVCGNNKKLRSSMEQSLGHKNNVHIIGYTNHPELYMKACDVIYTKPGGLTSTEAAVSQIPMVHTTPIPGCEEANRDFFMKYHLALRGDSIQQQIRLGRKLLYNEKLQKRMKQNQQNTINANSSEDIYQLLCRIVQQEVK